MPDVPPFNRYMGMELVRKADGRGEVAIELEPHHLNRRGVAHGGVVATLLDSALGAAVISSIPEEWWCATTSLSIQFIAGPRAGRVTGTGEVTRRGRRTAFARGEARDAAGKLLATAEGAWHLWPHHPNVERDADGPAVILRGSGERIHVGKILAVGRNYAAHVDEMQAPRDGVPLLFLKPATALVQDGGSVRIPAGAGEVHHEVELAVVIGKRGRGIPAAEALDHVLGYAVGLDMTLRERQTEAKRRGEPWMLSKGFDTAAPISRVAPAHEVGDPSGLGIRLDVNGERRQESDTSLMLHGVAELIAYASRTVTLERGDVLLTGTPEGVGPVRAGDTLRAEIDRVGTLTVGVEAGD